MHKLWQNSSQRVYISLVMVLEKEVLRISITTSETNSPFSCSQKMIFKFMATSLKRLKTSNLNTWTKLRNHRAINIFIYSTLLVFVFFFIQVNFIEWKKWTLLSIVASDVKRGIVVSYAYKDGSKSQRENLRFFISRGLTMREDVHYVFTLNDAPNCTYQKLIPRRRNIEIICQKNIGIDTCAHARVLRANKFQRKKYFVILNGSSRGPFSLGDCVHVNQSTPILHNYCASQGKKKIDRERKLDLAGRFWVDRFIKTIETSKNHGRLAGAYISCEKAPHVQSWLAVAHHDVLDNLKKAMRCFRSQKLAIEKGEVFLSTSVLRSGFNILSAIKEYSKTDFRSRVPEKLCRKHNPATALGFCPYGHCRSLNPLETVFFKNSGGPERDNVVDRGLEGEINYFTNILDFNF